MSKEHAMTTATPSIDEETPMKRQVLARLLLGALTLMVVGLGLFEAGSLNYRMVQTGGALAQASLAVLGSLAVLTLLDTAINDLLPERWHLQWACRNRHLLWALMAVTYAGYAYVLARLNMGPWLAVTFLVYACGCFGVAFFDLRYRAQERIRITGFGDLA